MATTNAELALVAVECLTKAQLPYAFLHGADRLISGEVSDLDVVVGVPARSVVRTILPFWSAAGLHPVVIWPYDIGGTATVFLANGDATEGVQLDFLSDPEGIGKYGIRTGSLLSNVVSSAGVPEIDPAASLVYQWTKRVVKGQLDRLPALRQMAGDFDAGTIQEVSIKLTGGEVAAQEILGKLEPGTSSKRLIPGSAEVRRMWNRARKPIGYWAHIPDGEVANETIRRFGRFLVDAEIGEAPNLSSPVWYGRTVRPVITRPAVFISVGRPNRLPAPFEVVGAKDPDSACSQLIGAMQSRVLR